MLLSSGLNNQWLPYGAVRMVSLSFSGQFQNQSVSKQMLETLRVVANSVQICEVIGSGRMTLLSIRVFLLLHFVHFVCLLVHVALLSFVIAVALIIFSFFTLFCVLPRGRAFLSITAFVVPLVCVCIYFIFLLVVSDAVVKGWQSRGCMHHFICCSSVTAVPLFLLGLLF